MNQVKNPFYGILPASVGVLGQPTVAQGYLLKPSRNISTPASSRPPKAMTTTGRLQVKVQKRLAAGVSWSSYSWAHLHGDVDVLTPWAEQNRYGVGGGEGVQDNTNIKGGESSISSFDVPNRLVFNYVLDLPFGPGHKYLSGVAWRRPVNWCPDGQ